MDSSDMGPGAYRRSWLWMGVAIAGAMTIGAAAVLGWPHWIGVIAELGIILGLRQEGYWVGYDKAWKRHGR